MKGVVDWNIILMEAKLQDTINAEEEKNSKFKTLSIYSIILEIIRDLRELGFKIQIDGGEPAV